MIAFNGQYLPAASHGNMRITAACLGGQWVIAPWHIDAATQQAIIAAFGAEEGKAVISRTNDYLNALALTDQTRAQQLAMFINEDPVGYGALFAQYTLISYIETTGTQYIRMTPLNTDGDFAVTIKVNITAYGSAWTPLLVNPYNGGLWIGAKGTQAVIRQYSGKDYVMVTPPNAGEDVEWKIERKGTTLSLYFNGELAGNAKNATFTFNDVTQTIVASDGSGTNTSCKILELTDNATHLLPVTRNADGEIGMFDIKNRTFYTNAGTGKFTAG